MGIKQNIARWFPERRLFLRTESETRFVRLGPATQVVITIGMFAFVGWSIVATAIILMDSIGTGNFRDQAKRDLIIYEDRMNALASERDVRAQEALAAQNRFKTALSQVSLMQSQLLESEDARRELERGIEVMQRKLRAAVQKREELRGDLANLQASLQQNGPDASDETIAQNNAASLDYMAQALGALSAERDAADQNAHNAQAELARIDDELLALQEKNDIIFRQLEDALTISVEPLHKMFRGAGL